jgi:hypothetical protein
MKNKLQFIIAFIGFVTFGNAQTCTDTVKYVNYKSKLVLNAGKKDSVNYLGKLKLKEGVAQSFINKDKIDVNGAVVRMSAQNSLNKYTPASAPMKVKVYLQTADEFDFHPLKRIDSAEVMVLKDAFYTVKFTKTTKIDGHFSISVVNAQSDSVRPRIYATNSTVLNGGYGEKMGFVTAGGKTQRNLDYFENSLPSSTTGYGFTSGGTGELIDWDYLIYPIISYDITPSITSTNPTPDNNGEVELTRMNSLSVGSNHMLSLSGFNKKYFGSKDSTYVWKVKGKVSLDSVYKFSYFTGDDLGSYTIKVKGYTSNCQSIFYVKDLAKFSCDNFKSKIISKKDQTSFEKKDGEAVVQAEGGTLPYSYSWNSQPVQTTNKLSLVESGFYKVTIKDKNNCEITDSVIIGITCKLSVTLKALEDETTTKKGFIEVEANGGSNPYSYSWSNKATSPSIYNLTKGIYKLLVKDSIGCEITKEYEVKLCDLAVKSIYIKDETYSGVKDGKASVLVEGGQSPYSYKWNTIPNQTLDTAIALNKGAYICIVTDKNGCSLKSTINIDTKCKLKSKVYIVNSESGSNKKDGKAVVQVTEGKLPYTYSWSSTPIQNTDTIKGIGVGKYFVTIKDANSCQHKDSVIMFTNPSTCNLLVDKTYSKPESYKGLQDGKAFVSVKGGKAPYKYEWNTQPKQISDTAHNLISGIYQVIIEDANKCKLIHNVDIKIECDISIKLIAKDEYTIGKKDGLAIVQIDKGTAPFSIIWNNKVSDDNDTLFNIGKGIYKVEVKDSKGCRLIDSINVLTTCELKLNFNVTLITQAAKEDGSVRVKVEGGLAPYSFEWDNGNKSELNTALKKGSYIVKVTDKNKCVITDSVFVGVANLESLSSLSYEVYPNPFSDLLTVHISNQGLSGDVQLKLIDFTGKTVYNNLFNASTLDTKTVLNVSDLLPGFYFLEIENNGRNVLGKLIKQ